MDAGPWTPWTHHTRRTKTGAQESVIEANCEIRVHKVSAKAGQTN